MSVKASVIIVTYNSSSTIEPCLRFLFHAWEDGTEVIIVDNASSDDTLSHVETARAHATAVIDNLDTCFKVIASEVNQGYSGGCDLGASHAQGEYLVFLNPDAIVFPGWLERLIGRFSLQGKIGAVGPITNYGSGLQITPAWFPDIDYEAPDFDGAVVAERVFRERRGETVEARSLVGFCLVVPAAVFQELGGFDKDLFLGNDDLDLSWRMQLEGYKMAIAIDTFIFHIGHVSFLSETPTKSQYLAGQSAYVLGEKLLRHYGRGKVPGPWELWGNPIFNEEEILQPLQVLVFKDGNEVVGQGWLTRFLETTPFELQLLMIGFSDEEEDPLRVEVPEDVPCEFASSINRHLAAKITTGRVLILQAGIEPGPFYCSDLAAAMFEEVDAAQPALDETVGDGQQIVTGELVPITELSGPCLLTRTAFLIEAFSAVSSGTNAEVFTVSEIIEFLNQVPRQINGYLVKDAKVALTSLDTR